MHWNSPIESIRARLVAVVVELFAEIGLTGDGMVERVSRPVYRKVQRVLRSAEAAARRLIIAAARDIVVEPSPRRPVPAARKSSSQITSKAEGEGHEKPKRKRGLLFRLFDRPRRKDWGIPRRRKTRKVEPRIHSLDFDPRIPWFLRQHFVAPAPAPAAPARKASRAIADGTVSALRLCRRLHATLAALEDIPRQARRYARWRDKPREERRPQRDSPLRLGWPPGWRIKSTHEVDEILKDCHWLVRTLQPDTS
jgi:hypothetical protein